MALGLSAKHFVDESIVFSDVGAALSLTLIHCTGDTSYSGANNLGGGNRALAAYQTRGGANATNGNTSLRAGAQEAATLTLSLQAYDYAEAATGTVRDWAYEQGPFAGVASTENDPDIFGFQVVRTMAAVGADSANTLTYTRCVITDFTEDTGEPNTFSLTLQVWGTEVAAVVP